MRKLCARHLIILQVISDLPHGRTFYPLCGLLNNGEIQETYEMKLK